jgi:uncharacterized membrane protein
MLASLDLWVEYILRFSHLVAGISWIGSSFYFIWLDSAFEAPEEPRHNVDGEVFMVHGGFYYQVDKRKIYPGELPKNMHWFKWEATLTFITGFMLFGYLYFLNGASLLINKSVLDLSQPQAIGLSLGLITASWFIYDFIYHPKYMKNKMLSNLLALIFSGALIYGATYLFSGRGAFIIVGVIYGSCMLLNVWVRILPNQAIMIKDAEEGRVPDYSLGKKSKARSVHNTYFIFPVLFIMLSNHYPSIYNHELSWVLLMIIMVAGAMFRQAMITKNPKERFLVIPASIGLMALVFVSAEKNTIDYETSEIVTYEEIEPIITKRCLQCHSTNNTDDVFKVAQKGIVLESEQLILTHKDKILTQVKSKAMPLANKTRMKGKERKKLMIYLKQQMK